MKRDEVIAVDWPAMAYVYTTWGYALSQARRRARSFGQRMWLYQSLLEGEPVWVVSWDPKHRPSASGHDGDGVSGDG